MIGRLTGILLEKQAPNLLIDVGGVGYELQAPMTTFYKLPEVGDQVILHTHLVSREDGQALYGFYTFEERMLFRMLIKISGVGPKLAITILSGVEPSVFLQCIANNDVSSLVRLPGIGKKTAERLIIEMRDRLNELPIGKGDFHEAGESIKDAISALLALGYRAQDANRVMAKYKDKGLSSEELIKLSLRDLST